MSPFSKVHSVSGRACFVQHCRSTLKEKIFRLGEHLHVFAIPSRLNVPQGLMLFG